MAATDVFVGERDGEKIAKALKEELKSFKSAEAYARAKEIADEILSDPRGKSPPIFCR